MECIYAIFCHIMSAGKHHKHMVELEGLTLQIVITTNRSLLVMCVVSYCSTYL